MPVVRYTPRSGLWVPPATPASAAPAAPTSVSAVAGNAQAVVSFVVPPGQVDGYRVTSTPATTTVAGTASPITVTGLTNGTPYTFRVAAHNSAGWSSDSAASNSVTPTVPAAGTCINPTFTTSVLDNGITLSGYYVHNNSWNSTQPQTLSVCNYNSWYVVSQQTNLTGTVMTYPNVHKDFSPQPTFASLGTITSNYAATGPGFGIYNIAYDIWINAYSGATSKELMIWTDYVGLANPGVGSRVAQNVSISGKTWDLWVSGSYMAYLLVGAASRSGTMDIKAFYTDLLSRGYVTPTDTILQIDYGTEIRSTNGVAARTDFTDFNVVTTAAPPGGEMTITTAYVTGYTYFDNTPPGSAAISDPVLHSVAGGTGTYADPITVAVGWSTASGQPVLNYAAGTRMYMPHLRRYFIVEDECGDSNPPQSGPCYNLSTADAGATTWVDIWIGGASGDNSASVAACANAITGIQTVIVNPVSTYPVVSGPVYGNGACTQLY